jgi:hypothetical protein
MKKSKNTNGYSLASLAVRSCIYTYVMVLASLVYVCTHAIAGGPHACCAEPSRAAGQLYKQQKLAEYVVKLAAGRGR